MQDSFFWHLTASWLAFLLPSGLLLVAASGLPAQRAWDAALGGLAAFCLASVGYWAVGFAFQFGSIGFLHVDQPGLAGLVRGWIPLPEGWGLGWIAAGLEGWFLSGPASTPVAQGLFLAHVSWAMTAALLPALALRGRAPALANLAVALLAGGLIYPLAGNWVQGGGWLAGMGRNLGLGHGLVDFSGAGTVFLVSSSASLAALLVWLPGRTPDPQADRALPSVHLPMLAVVGSMLCLAGAWGWMWGSPVQQLGVDAFTLSRTAVNCLLFAAGGATVPLLYTWFVTGASDPGMTARGLLAGVVAGLAAGPFMGAAGALVTGLLAGASVPFVTYALSRILLLNDSAGIIATAGLPAAFGLLSVGVFADGATGAGWQLTGIDSYLGVQGQGVTGFFAAQGYRADFPGQLQAQIIGVATLSFWGFVTGSLVCVPMALLSRALASVAETGRQPSRRRAQEEPAFRADAAMTNARRAAAPSPPPAEAGPPAASDFTSEEPRLS